MSRIFQVHKQVIALMAILLVASILSQSVVAQSNDGPLSEKERASFMFDLNVKEILNNPLMKDFDPQEMMAQQGIPQNDDFDIKSVNRIFGGIQLPSDPAAAQIQPGDDLPINFFVRFEMNDSAAVDKMMEEVVANADTHEVNGKTYYSPNDGGAPPNLRVHRAGNTTVEFGTERYVLLKDRNVISKNLAKYWKQVSKDTAIRLSIDLESNREMIDMAMEQAKASAPQGSEAFLGLVDDLSGLSIGLDFDSDKILTLRASGKDSESTSNLRDGIDGLLGMGKFMGQSQLSNAPIDDDSKKVLGAILGSLKATTEGNTVSVDIAKPEGFDEMAEKMMNQ